MMSVAYVMSRFPKLTETFILFEILAVEETGVRVELFPLLRTDERTMHPEARPLVDRANFSPFLSWPIVRSQWRALRRRPRGYIGALVSIVRHGFGSRNYLFGGLAIFPKAVHAGNLMLDAGVVHVHCHFSNHPATAGFVINRTTGLPFSFTAHGSDLHVDRHLLRLKLETARFAVTVSRFNRQVITEECGSELAGKVSILHCGVDLDVFRPANRAPGMRIVCVGTLHEVKGQRFLLEACAELGRAGIEYRCRLVGEGEDEAMLRQVSAELGITHRVEFLGRRTREEIAELLRDSTVLVAPSVPTAEGKREGIPVALMEGMSTGLPVVASNLSGIPELVIDEQTGLLVRPGDSSGIAAALSRLHDDQDLAARLGRNARELVETEFDVRANARRLVSLFGAEANR